MSNLDHRREFLTIIGKSYETYGYPEYCGWIEGLLLVEKKKWNQKGISERLGEIFPESKYPTSISSINRALQILEAYGIVEKSGSRKTGYQYEIASSKNLVSSMVNQFIQINTQFLNRLSGLESKKIGKDSNLQRAISSEIQMVEAWNEALEHLVETMEE